MIIILDPTERQTVLMREAYELWHWALRYQGLAIVCQIAGLVLVIRNRANFGYSVMLFILSLFAGAAASYMHEQMVEKVNEARS